MFKKTLWSSVVLAMATLSLLPEPLLADEIRSQPVSFKPGASSATLKGSLRGDQIVDYVLGARAGQTMSVTLKADNGANYFNVLPPGSDAAIAIGSNLGNRWTGALPTDGDYTVRVYLMRNAARRNENARYTLTVGIAGGAMGQAPKSDAKVAGTPYHATGQLPCSTGTDPKGSAQCSFGVIRGARGNAEVHIADPGFDVTLHKDHVRVIRIVGGKVTSANSKAKLTAVKKGEEWSIDIDDFHFYTIPEMVIFGG